jgi:hypothetical protein
MQTYTIQGVGCTAGQVALLRILTNKFHPLLNKGWLDTTLHSGYMFVLMGDNWTEQVAVLTAEKLIETSKDLKIKAKGAVRQSFTPNQEPIEVASRRPIISSRWQEVEGRAYDAATKMSTTGLRVNEYMAERIKNTYTNNTEYQQTPVWIYANNCSNYAGCVLYSDVFFDWRGRLYYQTGTYGSPQQSRFQRALMEAPEAVEVTDESFDLLMHIVSDEYDINIDNYSEVMASEIVDGDDALRIRAAYAIHEIITTGKTAYLVEQDATCSGGQIIALLTGDVPLAKATNVFPNQRHIEDLYSMLAYHPSMDLIWEAVEIDDPKVRRSLAKPAVMVGFYGGAPAAVVNNLWLKHDGDFDLNDEGDSIPCNYITIKGYTLSVEQANMICEQLCKLLDNYEGFKRFKGWGSSNAVKVIRENIEYLEWQTPSGFIARTNGFKSQAGLMPNYVHSLDAAIVHYVLTNSKFTHETILTIHDAFLSTVNNITMLKNVVREAYHTVLSNAEIPTFGGKLLIPMDTKDYLLEGLMNAHCVGV